MSPAKPLLAALLLSAPLAADEAAKDVSVMSFNIRYGTAKDGPDAWSLRRDLVAETITRFSPDLLGLQEALEFQVDFLKESLPDHAVYSVPREPGGGEACSLFYRKATFEPVSQGTFWLSDSPDKPGSKSWDSSLPRIVSWLLLRHKSSGDSLLFANTHFDHRGAEARSRSADLIRSRLHALAKGAPIILTGDFNCPESSDPHKTLTSGDLALTDSFRASHPDPDPTSEGTFGGFTPRTDSARIDWILSSPTLKILSASIDRHSREGRLPSDHFPVTATFRLP